MVIASVVLGIISTLWALLAGSWVSAGIGLAGAILGSVALKQKANGASIGLCLSANGIAWFVIREIFDICVDSICDLLG